jgi:uncharacterized protein YcnI
MNRALTILLSTLFVLLVPAAAGAHVSIVSGPALANTTQAITFGVGHGCEGTDTVKVRVQIPAGVTSVRPMASAFGAVSVEKDDAGTVTAVVWQKADALDGDIAYYELAVRLKVPNAPFTTIYFPSQQTCRAADGGTSSVGWTQLPGADAGINDEPAPALSIVPAHQPGWNKVTAPVAVTNLATYFPDAQIVWKGMAAYSANPTTADLIKTTSGVTTLTAIAANDELWVKY